VIRCLHRLASLAVSGTVLSAAAHAGELTMIPVPAGAAGYSFMTGVSRDGSVACGYAPGTWLCWQRGLGLSYLGGNTPGQGGGAWARMSDDGTRFSAEATNEFGRACGGYYLVPESRFVTAPAPSGTCHAAIVSAWGISRDGSTVVGTGTNATCTARPAFWSAGSASGTDLYAWFGWSARASAANRDGSVCVGWQATATGFWQGCRWVRNGSTWSQQRFAAADGTPMGEAQCCSDDGTRVFGFGDIDGVRQPYRWTAAEGAVGLGPGLALGQAFAPGCNADGTMAVVFFRAGTPLPVGEGFVWIQGRGYVELEAYALEHGVAIPEGVHLAMPLDMGSDGLSFCGTARDASDGVFLFVLDLHAAHAPCDADLDGNGVVDGADLGLLLGNWDGQGVGDLNQDGTIDGADLGALLGAFGTCP
jgi:hypothetical protein